MELFDSLKEKHMGFIGIQALAGGLLTNKRVDRNNLLKMIVCENPEWDRFIVNFMNLEKNWV
jgi:hypothetical protein